MIHQGSHLYICTQAECTLKSSIIIDQGAKEAQHNGHQVIGLKQIREDFNSSLQEIISLGEKSNKLIEQIDKFSQEMKQQIDEYCKMLKERYDKSKLKKQFRLIHYLTTSESLDSNSLKEFQAYIHQLNDKKFHTKILEQFSKFNKEIESHQLKLGEDLRKSLQQSQKQLTVVLNGGPKIQLQTASDQSLLDEFGENYFQIPFITQVPQPVYEEKLLNAQIALIEINDDSNSQITNPKVKLALLKLIWHDIQTGSEYIDKSQVGRKYIKRLTDGEEGYQRSTEMVLQLICDAGRQIYGSETQEAGKFLMSVGRLCCRVCNKLMFYQEKQILEEAINLLRIYESFPSTILAQALLGCTMYKSGQRDEALQMFENCLNETNWEKEIQDPNEIIKFKWTILSELVWIESIQPQNPKIQEYVQMLETYQFMLMGTH